MHLLWSLIVGLVVGVFAKAIHPGKDPGGIVERAAGLLTEAAQRCTEHPAADGWSIGHQGAPLLSGQRRRRWLGTIIFCSP